MDHLLSKEKRSIGTVQVFCLVLSSQLTTQEEYIENWIMQANVRFHK